MSSFGSGSGSTHPFDDDGYTGYDPQFPSQRFDGDSVKDSPLIFSNQPYVAGDDVFGSQAVPGTQSPPSIYSDGPLLPSAADMQPEEGFAVLREWRRCNAIELEEKEKREKEKLQQIIEEAEAYKIEFYRKQKVSVEKKKAWNRESEKVFVENQERFHAEAEKNYWKAIAQLVPREVAAIERRGKKEKERDKKKASIVVVMGPKPGKPTDLSRMRQVLVNLSHHPPPHMNPKTAPSPQTKNDAKPNASAAVGTSLAVAAA